MRCAFSFARTAVVAVPLLLLASNGAQAPMPSDPRNQCGALAGTPPAADCSNQAYANGILYDGVGGGVASDVTLTIRGGAATTITAPSSPVTAWKDDAIIVVTTTGTSRDIVLNVAAGDDDGNAVVIVGGGARLAQASSSITMAMPTTTRR